MRNFSRHHTWIAVASLLSMIGLGCATPTSPAVHEEDRRIAEWSKLGTRVDLVSILKECSLADLSLEPPKNLRVNGHRLGPIESKHVQWIAHCVLPNLPGDSKERADITAKATWWSLREGMLDRAENVFKYDTCHEDGKDRLRSNLPLYNCPTNIWQVGLPAAQVMNYSEQAISEVITRLQGVLDPNLDENSLLAWTAILAGYPEGSAEYRGILKSTGRVRRSWLVRCPLIGFPLVAEEEVRRECLIDHHPWCVSGNYPSAVRYSHTHAGVVKSIADLRKIFLNRLAE